LSDSLSIGEARRIALAAQGFDRPPPDPTALAKQVGAIQLDSVNVLVRAHYLPLFARLGPYPRDALDRAAWGARHTLFEYWGHEASLLPLQLWPLFEFRRQRARTGSGTYRSIRRLAVEKPQLIASVEREIRERGPLGAGELTGQPRGSGGWWGWSEHKMALEYLFWSGRLTTAYRRNFERVYDLTERVIPEKVRALAPPDEQTQRRRLLAIAASAMGVATARDLALYFRFSQADAKAAIAELAGEGALREVRVEGWKQPAWLARGARLPAEVPGASILAPFDSLVWDRARVERLFGFHYRISIYTPKHLRVHGYYVLPVRVGERLVARVDLKSDRAARALLMRGLHFEKGVKRGEVMPALNQKLRELATWLGLERVRRG